MKQLTAILLCVLALFSSCKKDNPSAALVGQWAWTIEYTNDPGFNSTPQSSGIAETFAFNSNGSYSLTRNSVVVNSGTYRTSTTNSTSGAPIATVLFTNSRVTDSAAYYTITNNSDSLIFSHDLKGTAGSGSRHYGRL